MAALDIAPSDHIVAIASGGCNILSYLTANPARISAVDLNGAHIALGHLKLAAARHLPDYEAFLRFFGKAHIARECAPPMRRYQAASRCGVARLLGGTRLDGERRIRAFAKISTATACSASSSARGISWRASTATIPARCSRPRAAMEQQRSSLRAALAPIFDKPLLRWLIRSRPPSTASASRPRNIAALRSDLPDGIGAVLRQRLEHLACGFDIKTNYFAWQAFGRRYA